MLLQFDSTLSLLLICLLLLDCSINSTLLLGFLTTPVYFFMLFLRVMSLFLLVFVDRLASFPIVSSDFMVASSPILQGTDYIFRFYLYWYLISALPICI